MNGVTRGERGFTLIEILVAIVVSTVLMAAIFQVLVSSQRIYTIQGEQVLGQQTIRSGAELVSSELRSVSPTQGDILDMAMDRVRFQRSRRFGIACQVTQQNPLQLLVDTVGGRGFEAGEEVVLFVEGDPETPADDAWVRGEVQSVTGNLVCPGDRPAQSVVLGSLSWTPAAGAVRRGAQIRSLETLTYGRIGSGEETYLGRVNEDGEEVPLVGPVAPTRGITFRYLDDGGAETAEPTEVRRIEIVVRTVSEARRPDGRPVADSMMIAVHTRN